MANLAKRTSAFNVERVRAEMLERVRIPDALLQKAFNRLDEELDAKKTEFFAHQGVVINQKDVIAHEARLNAIDKVMKVAGVYSRETDIKNETPQVAMEIDQKTGVMRLVIGSSPPGNGGNHDGAMQLNAPNTIEDERHGGLPHRELAPSESDQLSLFDADGVYIDDKEETSEVQVISTKGKTPPEVIAMLFRGDVG